MRLVSIIILFILVCLTPVLSEAQQVDITRDAESGYFLIVTADSILTDQGTFFEGDTLSINGQDRYLHEYTATRAGLTLMAQNDLRSGSVEVRGGNRLRLSVDLWYYEDIYIEEVVDTVFVPQDTIFVEVPGDTIYLSPEEELYSHLNIEVATPTNNPDQHIITSTAVSKADSVTIQYDCDGSVIDKFSFADGVFYDRHVSGCMQDMNIMYSFWQEGELSDTTKFVPGWVFTGDVEEPQIFSTDFSDYNSEEWTQTWGDLLHWVQGDTLFLELPERNVARLQWDVVPEHRNARFRIVETVHDSHSSGIHAGLRTSLEDWEHAAENHIIYDGFGVSLFYQGAWSNPVTFPFEWDYGEKIEYELEVIEETITIRYEGQEWSYESEEVEEMPNGFFAMGSTGSGLYIIHEVEVEILD